MTARSLSNSIETPLTIQSCVLKIYSCEPLKVLKGLLIIPSSALISRMFKALESLKADTNKVENSLLTSSVVTSPVYLLFEVKSKVKRKKEKSTRKIPSKIYAVILKPFFLKNIINPTLKKRKATYRPVFLLLFYNKR